MTKASLHSLKLLTNSELVRAEMARRSLREFIKQAWHVVEPVYDYITGWHIDAMADHLQACSAGQIKKLAIAVPPGHMKSMLSCVLWTPWEWISKPHIRVIAASYSDKFSIRDHLKTIELVRSPWYQRCYGHNFRIKKANNDTIENDKTGFRIPTSTVGVGTGHRVDRVISDDLMKAQTAHSEARQNEAIKFMEAMSTRAVRVDSFVQLIIMQRLNEKDPVEWALDHGFEPLILPAEFEMNRRPVTSIGFSDPRQEDGELLWPERFPREYIDDLKILLGPYNTAAQLQQRPSPLEGGIIKYSDFQYYQMAPKFKFILQSWDTAFKDKEKNDFSVCMTIGITENGYYLIDRWKGKVEFPELLDIAKQQYNKHKPHQICIEDKASGQSLIQSMRKNTKMAVKAIPVDTDKVARANAVSPLFRTGRVWVPEDATWVMDYMDCMCVFPNGAHDDDMDSTSQGLIQSQSFVPVKTFIPSTIAR